MHIHLGMHELKSNPLIPEGHVGVRGHLLLFKTAASICVYVCVCVCACACVRACVSVSSYFRHDGLTATKFGTHMRIYMGLALFS